ncbi:MAG: hypothetical protein AAFN70_10795, partial [Planctomycetota bacterium]
SKPSKKCKPGFGWDAAIMLYLAGLVLMSCVLALLPLLCAYRSRALFPWRTLRLAMYIFSALALPLLYVPAFIAWCSFENTRCDGYEWTFAIVTTRALGLAIATNVFVGAVTAYYRFRQ